MSSLPSENGVAILRQAAATAHVKAAEEAGGIARSLQHQLRDVRYKGEKDVVTEADFACDAAIRKSLSAAYPAHNIITEEEAAVEVAAERGQQRDHRFTPVNLPSPFRSSSRR